MGNYYEEHIQDMASKLTTMMNNDALVERVKNTIRNDQQYSEDHKLQPLYFLVDPKNGQNPDEWILKAVAQYDRMDGALVELGPISATMKCLYVKLYRKELQKLRKAFGGKMPTDEQAAEYYAAQQKTLGDIIPEEFRFTGHKYTAKKIPYAPGKIIEGE